jgi:hypothetical protein
MKRIHLFLSLSLLSWTTSTFAGSIQVAQWMPWSLVKSEILKTPLKVDVQQAQLTLSWQELNPVIKGVNFHVAGDLDDLTIDSQGISGVSTHLAAEISLDQLSIDQYLLRNISGNQIRIHVKADCTPVKVIIPKFTVRAQSLFKPTKTNYHPELSSIALEIAPGSWTINPFTCNGVGGVGQEIAALISSQLSNPATLDGFLKSWLRDEIQLAWEAGWNNLIQSTDQRMNILYMDHPQDQGVSIVAEIPITGEKKILLGALEIASLSKTIPQLILSSEGFNALIEDRMLSLAPKNYNIQQISGFASLMKSRLQQTFAWPDLKRFPTDTPFYLSSLPDQTKIVMTPKGNKAWGLQVNGNGNLSTVIGTSPIDYLVWGIALGTDIKCELKDSIIKFTTAKATVNLAWNFGTVYQMFYKPNSKISVDIIKDAIAASFSNKAAAQELPILHFHNHDWKLQNFTQTNKFITMDWIEGL